jgi:hypothetical protein
MGAEVEQPSLVTVVSAHAGEFGGRLGFCGDGDQPPVLTLDTLGTLGAASMLLLDACYASALAAELKSHARPGSLIVGLGHEEGEDPFHLGQGQRHRHRHRHPGLCYPVRPDLSPGAGRTGRRHHQCPDTRPQ